MWDAWWYQPIRLLRLWRLPIFSVPWFVLVSGLFGPPLIYVASWWRIKDSILEDTMGAAFWLIGGTYVTLLIGASICSDVLCLWAIKPPLCVSCLIGSLVASLIVFLSLAKITDGISRLNAISQRDVI